MEAKWYVYELIDPRDDSVFYVGKCSGKRIYQHEAEARRGVCSYKCNKIRHLWSLNLQVKRRYVAWFWDEKAAYEHETERIKSYKNITNVVRGNGFRYWTPYSEKEEKPKEIKIESALGFLLKRTDLLANYLRITEGDRKRVVTVEVFNATPIWKRLIESFCKMTYNWLIPTCLDKVVDSPTDWAKVQEALLPYGVILENGSTKECIPA